MQTAIWNGAKRIHSVNVSSTGALTATIDNAAAVDAGYSETYGKHIVTIPITGHPLVAESVVYISGTTNYDGYRRLVAVAANTVTIIAPYVAETFAGTEVARAEVAPGVDFKLIEVRLHFDSAATQDTFTVTLDSGLGSAYDAVIYSQAMAGLADLVWIPEEDRFFNSDDGLVFAFDNNDAVTIGLEILVELAK